MDTQTGEYAYKPKTHTSRNAYILYSVGLWSLLKMKTTENGMDGKAIYKKKLSKDFLEFGW